MKFRSRFAGFLIASLTVFSAAAEKTQRYNVIELAASAQRDIANDLMSAQLFVEASDANPAQLATTLNRAVADGVRMAKDYPVIKVRTGNNQTFPVYGRNNQSQGWRGRAELRIETRDFAAGAALVGKLQASLQLGGIQFGVAPETRQKVESELITEAIAAFRSRAEIARAALGGKSLQDAAYRHQRRGRQPAAAPVNARRRDGRQHHGRTAGRGGRERDHGECEWRDRGRMTMRVAVGAGFGASARVAVKAGTLLRRKIER